jgi:nicotinamide-nucleotide amidase
MLAEVVSIGDELTSGQRLDTNSQWLSLQLGDLGVTVHAHQTIGDYLGPMRQAFRIAAERSDVVLVTGGLGPTQDDLTRQALAEAFGVGLEFHAPSWQAIQAIFLQRGRSIPESNRLQAMFPSGSVPIPNPHGTAPGIHWRIQLSPSTPPQSTFPHPGSTAGNETTATNLAGTQTAILTGIDNLGENTHDKPSRVVDFFCLPGVPVEMREMFTASVSPKIFERRGSNASVVVRRVIKTFGAGESQVEKMLPNLIVRGNDPQVGITASQATISLRLQTLAPNVADGEAFLQPTIRVIEDCLGPLVFGRDDEELEDIVWARMEQTDIRWVVVEWGTAGMVAQRLSEAAYRAFQLTSANDRRSATTDIDRGLMGAVILTSPPAVERWLAPDLEGVDLRDLPSTVEGLAQVAARRFQADLAVACGPLPNPTLSSGDTSATPFCLHVYYRPRIDLGAVQASDATVWRPIPNTPNTTPTLPRIERVEENESTCLEIHTSESYSVLGHPSLWRPRAAKQVLNLLRRIRLFPQ